MKTPQQEMDFKMMNEVWAIFRDFGDITAEQIDRWDDLVNTKLEEAAKRVNKDPWTMQMILFAIDMLDARVHRDINRAKEYRRIVWGYSKWKEIDKDS